MLSQRAWRIAGSIETNGHEAELAKSQLKNPWVASLCCLLSSGVGTNVNCSSIAIGSIIVLNNVFGLLEAWTDMNDIEPVQHAPPRFNNDVLRIHGLATCVAIATKVCPSGHQRFDWSIRDEVRAAALAHKLCKGFDIRVVWHKILKVVLRGSKTDASNTRGPGVPCEIWSAEVSKRKVCRSQ